MTNRLIELMSIIVVIGHALQAVHDCHVTVVDRLIDEDAPHVRSLAASLDTSISCQVEVSYSQEQFDVIRTLRND